MIRTYDDNSLRFFYYLYIGIFHNEEVDYRKYLYNTVRKMKTRYITKSRFKLALECPTKIYYDGKPEYANQKLEDTFLLALADGGFQIGELAKCYFPGGHDIKSLDYDDALIKTNELLKGNHVIIYEAAVRSGNFFIRVDILVKNGNSLEFIEVKSKSFDGNTEEDFLNKNGTISSSWREYLADAAFQKFVIEHAFPDYSVSANLMLADKSALCPTDGLNQKFRVVKDANGRKSVSVSPDLSKEDLSVKLLKKINVETCCEILYQEQYGNEFEERNYIEFLDYLAENYAEDRKITSPPSTACGSCEFQTTEDDEIAGLKSGFCECWKETLGWTDNDFAEQTIFDIWNYRRKDKRIGEGRIKVSELNEDDISPKEDRSPGLSSSQRQWLQVQKAQCDDLTCWIDEVNLKSEMDKWVYPLHFIDFETSMVAIPFNKGRHPYEGIAFQFSHHIVYSDGNIEHHGQYLNVTPGQFPNYDFVRNLKEELEHDEGSIFRYAAHENTYLNFIYRQLQGDQADISDRESLCDFIRTITKSVSSSAEVWEGQRSMIDMLELVKRFYYNPDTRGSNSIKYVLPAMLNNSEILQEKYGKPMYGAAGGIKSLNYKDWKWIEYEDGRVKDPYKLLPKLFQDVSNKDLRLLSEDNELSDGGAAMTAYARLQFEDMSDYEREEIRKALLKYCELDTLAMVMLYEGWKDLIG